jgi:tape measure domain-containing protein
MAGKVTTQVVIEGKNNAKRAFAEVTKDLESLDSTMRRVGQAAAGYFTFSALTSGIRVVTQTADAYKLMEARLKLATGSQDEFNRAQQELSRIAGATATPMESLVTLYGRISRPLKEAGRSQEDILKVTEAVATAFRVSGASAAEAENGVVQFAQALGSGALRGDEFNSVAEQAPRLMQALADGIGVPVGALKELASQGKLTADVVTNALVGQLPKLQAELVAFGETVGSEVVQIQDVLNKGIGQADTGPLIDALQELKKTLQDPEVMAGLTNLAAALIRVAEAGAKAGAGLAGVGDDIGYIAARLAGNVDELARVDKEIEVLQASMNGLGVLDIYMSDEAIAKKLKEFQDYRAQLVAEMTGIKEDASRIAEQGLVEAQSAQQRDLEARRQWVSETKVLNEQLVNDGEAALKKRVALERKAAADLATAKAAQLETEQRYKDAIAKLQGGGAEEASFSSVTALKVGARQALQGGDLEGAKRQAEQALQILLTLKEAGENSYGFVGIAKELQQIEQAADGAAVTQGEDRLKVIAVQTEALKQDLEALKSISISPAIDQQAADQVAEQMKAFAASIGQTVVIKPVIEGAPEAAALPGYAAGTNSARQGLAVVGERGPEIVAFGGGEKVFTASASQRLAQRLNGMEMPDVIGPEVASMAATMATPPHLGTLQLDLGGGQALSVDVPGGQADQLKLLGLKFGRPGGRRFTR